MKTAADKNAKERQTLTGRVERVFFSKPGWTAGRIKDDSGSIVGFAGSCTLKEGDQVRLYGSWRIDPKYGRQLDVQGFEFAIPADAEGIAAYIAGNPAMKGIGPARARKLAVQFASDWDKALESRASEMAAFAKVKPAVIETLRDEWRRSSSFNQAAAWLAVFGLSHKQIAKLVDKYGNNVIPIMQADPYLLIREVRGFGFSTVDAIACRMGTPKEHPSRLRAGVLHCLAEAADGGHCWTDYEALLHEANKLLALDSLDSYELINAALEQLVGSGDIVSEQVGARLLAATPHLRNCERNIKDWIAMAQGQSAPLDAEALSQVELPPLTDGQAAALRLAAGSRIMVLSGGAGTGKTYAVNAICKLYESQEKTITLCAPTGKAAKRMEESTGRTASTLHRLLRYNGRVFEFTGEIDTDLLVLDEVSMVDVPLFAELIEHVNPERTALLLVGDHNQLPPVGPGNILRDLIQHRLVPASILNQVVRQAGDLKRNSTAILGGHVAPGSETRTACGLRVWQVVNNLRDPQELLSFISELYSSVLIDKYGLDILRDVQVLTPQRKGPLGVGELNLMLQRIVQHHLYGVNVAPQDAKKRPRFYAGDKIIQRRNNYELEIMNGSIGIVRQVLRDGKIEADFDGRVLELNREQQAEADLAYALTIHQTQGSEFPVALVICHKSQSFMHHRNLLYTGVTRASRACAVLGDHWAIQRCAQNVEVAKRRTWLDAWAVEENENRRSTKALRKSAAVVDDDDDVPW